MQAFLVFIFLISTAWASEPLYFYKNKFPGSTCVPLSFYISTAMAPKGNPSFWSGIEGENAEDKFDRFLTECTRVYNPSYKMPLMLSDEKNDALSFSFMDHWEESPLVGILSGFLPLYTTVQDDGMWLHDLLSVIKRMNPSYAKSLELEFKSYSADEEKAKPAFAKLHFLKQKIQRSLKNGFLPVMAWDNLYRDSKLSNWVRMGGHAVTLTRIEEVEEGVYDTRLKFRYIDNEDGVERDGEFYLLGDVKKSTLEEINPMEINRIHVSMNYLEKDRLFTLHSVLYSNL